MLRKLMTVLMLMFAVATVAGCTSHPDDKGDVTGRSQENTPRYD
jgi:hypothetical protein